MQKVTMYRGESGDLFNREEDALKDDALCRFFNAYSNLTERVDGFSDVHDLTAHELDFITEGMVLMHQILTDPEGMRSHTETVEFPLPPDFAQFLSRLSTLFDSEPGAAPCACGKCGPQ